MPRNKRHGNVTTVERSGSQTEYSENAVSAAVTDVEDNDVDAGFELSMEAAPADYSPERKTPGRQRRESYFDTRLRASDVFNQGWQRVPVHSAEQKAYVLRELNRAKLYLNGTGRLPGEPEIGLDLDDKKDDAVYFKSRVAQKRERKDNGANALAANAQQDGAWDADGDNDE